MNTNSQHDINGWTALHWAAKRNHLNIVNLLCNHGADKNVTTNKGEVAAQLTSEGVIKVLYNDFDFSKSAAKVMTMNQFVDPAPILQLGVVECPSIKVGPSTCSSCQGDKAGNHTKLHQESPGCLPGNTHCVKCSESVRFIFEVEHIV